MRPTYSYHDVMAPRIYLEASGALAQDILQYVTKFEFESDAAKATTLKLTVANPDFKFTEDKRLKTGVSFKVCWGYPTDMSPVQKVTITRAKPTFPSGGTMPTIELVAFDLRYDMTVGSNPKNWGKVSSSEVARKIAETYGFNTDIDDSGDARKRDRIQPIGSNDFMYLQALAKPLFFACYLDGNVLHFHKYRTGQTPSLEFVYFNDDRSTVIEFTPEVNMNKPGGVKAVGASPKDNKTINVESKSGIPQMGHTPIDRFTGPGNSNIRAHQGLQYWELTPELAEKTAIGMANMQHRLMLPTEERDPSLASKLAAAAAGKLDMAAVKATLKVIGTPRLKANEVIRLSGVGSEYSGNWYVVTAKHTISPTGSTYVTELKLSRNALNKKKANQPTDADKAIMNDKATVDAGDTGYSQKHIQRITVDGRIKAVEKGGTQSMVARKIAR
jgi:phage protein D